jgi:hypothetical protein
MRKTYQKLWGIEALESHHLDLNDIAPQETGKNVLCRWKITELEVIAGLEIQNS